MRQLLSWALSGFALAALATSASAQRVEDAKFPTNTVPRTNNDAPIELAAKLYLPYVSSGPLAAVVISPSSAGVRKAREVHYAEALAKAGIAALVIDSFGSRGVANSVYDQRLLTRWQSGNDAVAGLRWLTRDPRFRPDRIGVLGVSKGGVVALDNALVIRRRWMRATNVRFAAHVPIAPGCQWTNRSLATTGAPILFLLAELDDATPAAACITHAERLKAAGNPNVEVKLYKGMHHGWEALGDKPHFDPWVENYARCRVWIEDDGALISADDGSAIPKAGWHAWAGRSCMKLGATCCGGTEEAKQQATRDVIAFLKKNGF